MKAKARSRFTWEAVAGHFAAFLSSNPEVPATAAMGEEEEARVSQEVVVAYQALFNAFHCHVVL